MNANVPPQRPAQPQQSIPAMAVRTGGVAMPAIPPLYANAFDVNVGEYDFSIRFQQRDPYLDALTREAEEKAVDGEPGALSLLDLDSQLPSQIIALSRATLEALHAELGKVLGG